MRSTVRFTQLVALAMLSLVGINGWSQAPAKAAPQFHEIARAEFDQLLEKPEKFLILDLRRPDEISKIGSFAVYLNVQPADLESHLNWIPKDRAIITVSNHVTRSGRAAELLKSKGFTVLGALGAQTYEEAGGKLNKVAIPPPRQTADAPKKS